MTGFLNAKLFMEEQLPDLNQYLCHSDFEQLEAPESRVVEVFRQSHGARALVKKKYGGLGLDAEDVLKIQLAIGSYSPSLAIASGMHQFSIATLQSLAIGGQGLESLMLEAIAKNNLLVASAFSEGKVGQSILQSDIVARPEEKGVYISGTKMPCSLAQSMDLLTASVVVRPHDHRDEYFAVAMIHKDTPGLTVVPSWTAPFLRASQTESIVLDDVFVPWSMLVNVDGKQAYHAHLAGFAWFELITSVSYLGMAFGLIEKVAAMGRLEGRDKLDCFCQLESQYLALKSIARDIDNTSESTLAESLIVRYHTQKVITDVASLALSRVGGIHYIKDSYFATLAQVLHAFNYHPPAKHVMVEPLNTYFSGHPLKML
ncbi:acyl-CoA dehydrogenase family protein [Photobacterium leiognathi]|uniref:acyl-CoA dehydrogenase family protein n=1 Tax=Photobacterium leiognathi TaxID=553611 RepID=UPI002981139F|nr:acyl-CoA dehydrogenase family protein [Photobacterium leiognathi]